MEENEEIFKKSFTKDSIKSTKDSTNRQKTQQRDKRLNKETLRTQQRDTKDLTTGQKNTK